jgi:hypothetical protein
MACFLCAEAWMLEKVHVVHENGTVKPVEIVLRRGERR